MLDIYFNILVTLKRGITDIITFDKTYVKIDHEKIFVFNPFRNQYEKKLLAQSLWD
jgi:hypothetical protein